MRVLRVIASVNPRHGGPIEGLRLSAGEMQNMGHETEVVSLDDPSASHVKEFGFPVHACGPAPKKYGFNTKLSKWIRENAYRYDAAVIHGLWNHASVGGWQGLKSAGLPFVVYTHGMMDPWFREAYPLKHMAKQLFWLLWQGKVLRDAEQILFTSKEEMQSAAGVFWGHTYAGRTVAYGSAQPTGRSDEQDKAFHKALGVEGSLRYLLFMSRIHPKKGCDLVINAFAKIAERYPHLHLVVAGPDQVGMVKQLTQVAEQAGLQDRIHFPGMLSGDAKWGAFYGAEAFFLPSHQENFGIVVAEALACGTPVLISNKVNIWREVSDAGAGLVDEDTIEGAERLLHDFIALPPSARNEMSHAALDLYKAKFSVTGAASDLTEVLQAAIRSRSS